MLTPELQAEILALYFTQHKSVRAIARQLGLNRKSVERVIRRKSVQTTLVRNPRSSLLDPFKPQLTEWLNLNHDITNAVLLQRIREKGYEGGLTILGDWMTLQRKALKPPAEAFLKLQFEPGECAQVDWGEFGTPFSDGVKVHCFVMVLCCSRLLYVEFTRSEKFETFIRCHENAFRYFGNKVPMECQYDNLTTAVTERAGKLVRFNARFFTYMGHHGIRPYACNPARGNEKGRVENGVKYVRYNFWTGRTFTDFDDLCRQAACWRDEIANRREHRSTRKIPELYYENEEKHLMRDMNDVPYDTDEVYSEEVQPDFHLTYETNQYSVPWTLVGCVVSVRVDATSIRVYYHEKFITRHERCYLKHQKPFTHPEHEAGLLEIKQKAQNPFRWQLEALEQMGPSLTRYLQILRTSSRSIKQELARLLALSTVYGSQMLEKEVGNLLRFGSSIGVAQIELALKKNQKAPPKPEPMELEDPRLKHVCPTKDLRHYDTLLFSNPPLEHHPEPQTQISSPADKEVLDASK